MRMDVAPRAALAVAVQPVAEALQQLHDRPAGEQRGHCVVIHAEQQQERREIGRIPFPGNVGLGEADVATLQQAPTEAEVMDDDLGCRSGFRSLEAIAPAVGQLCDQAAVADLHGIAEGGADEGRQIARDILQRVGGHGHRAKRAIGGVTVLMAALMRCSPAQDQGSSRARWRPVAAQVSRKTRSPSTIASWPRYGCPQRPSMSAAAR